MTEKCSGVGIGLEAENWAGNSATELSSKMQGTLENSESVLWQHIREDRRANMAQKVQQMKQRPKESEQERKSFPNFKKKDKQRNENFPLKTSSKEDSPYRHSEAEIDRHLNIQDLRIFCSSIHFEPLRCQTGGPPQKLKWGLINL